MSEIVTLHHNEPMTTSLAIADGVEMEHKSVLQLIRSHVEDLAEFGGVAFEMRPFETNGGKQWRDVYFLNEQQSTLLITFMRNSPVVIAFKKALVRAFFELRSRASAPTIQRFSDPALLIPSHEADKIVSSDRVFRAALRSARASGMPTLAAENAARQIAVQVSGVDLAGILQKAHDETRIKGTYEGAIRYIELWRQGQHAIPFAYGYDRWELYNNYHNWSYNNRYKVMREEGFFHYVWEACYELRNQQSAARNASKQ